MGFDLGGAISSGLNDAAAAVDNVTGFNWSGQNNPLKDVEEISLDRKTAEELGFDQQVLTDATQNRESRLQHMLRRRGGMDARATKAFGTADQAGAKAMSLADRIGGMAGRDSGFFRGLEGQGTALGSRTQALGQETRGLQRGSQGLSGQFASLGKDLRNYRGELDRLASGQGSQEQGMRQALTARAKEGIQRDVEGQKLAMQRTLASRGVDPSSMKALTAVGGIDANAMQQKRLAQQDANFNAMNMSQQRMNQRANLIQAGMGAVGQQGGMVGQQSNMLGQQQGMIGQRQNFVNARQNMLNNLRQGRAQEFGMDQSALGQSAGLMSNISNADRQFGMANTQMAVGLDQAGIQDAVFDINRMDQKQLAAMQINAGIEGQEAQANAASSAAASQSNANQQSNTMGMLTTAATVKVMFMCIPEGTLIDVDKDYRVDIKDIRPGRKIIGYNGEKVTVLQKHEYLEDPSRKRFLHIEFDDGAKIDLCDMHRVEGIRAKDLKVGDALTDRKVLKITKFDNVTTSYDLLTKDGGYRINGVPVNSMIEEVADMTAYLRKVA